MIINETDVTNVIKPVKSITLGNTMRSYLYFHGFLIMSLLGDEPVGSVKTVNTLVGIQDLPFPVFNQFLKKFSNAYQI